LSCVVLSCLINKNEATKKEGSWKILSDYDQ
jgi:hypothetical protein